MSDPDEPGFAQDVDIETATSSWWGPVGKVTSLPATRS